MPGQIYVIYKQDPRLGANAFNKENGPHHPLLSGSPAPSSDPLFAYVIQSDETSKILRQYDDISLLMEDPPASVDWTTDWAALRDDYLLTYDESVMPMVRAVRLQQYKLFPGGSPEWTTRTAERDGAVDAWLDRLIARVQAAGEREALPENYHELLLLYRILDDLATWVGERTSAEFRALLRTRPPSSHREMAQFLGRTQASSGPYGSTLSFR